MKLKSMLWIVLLVAAAGGGYYYWLHSQPDALPKGIASSNGRIEAVEIDPDLLKEYVRSVKTGLPGMAYVRLSEDVDWPANLEVKLPQ